MPGPGEQTPVVMNRENPGTLYIDALVVNGPASAQGLNVTGSTGGVFVPVGLIGDGKIITDGAMLAGSNILTSTSGPFVPADVLKNIQGKGAAANGVTTAYGTITQYLSPTQVVVSFTNTSGGNVTGITVLWSSDDTAAIQAGINLATAWALAHSGAATVRIPAATGQFYGIGGPLVTGGTTLGNAQLTLPVIATTGQKVTLTIEGPSDGSSVQHWQQVPPAMVGVTLVSYLTFGSASAQNNNINANGNPAVVGGPTQPNTYGQAGNYSNMHLVLRNMAVRTAHSTWGLGLTAVDAGGLANASFVQFGYGTLGTAANGDFGNQGLLGTGASIGLILPMPGNNDLCVIQRVTCAGGYTYAIFATEHTDMFALRILYCFAGVCPVGTYWGSVGATHAIHGFVSVEACKYHLYIIGPGSSGIGPFLHLIIDTEGTVSIGDNTGPGGSGLPSASALGEVILTGLFTPSAVILDHPIGFRLVNDQASFPMAQVAGNYTVGPMDEAVEVDATAGNRVVTLPTSVGRARRIVVAKTDASVNTVTVTAAAGQTINGAATLVLATKDAATELLPSGTHWRAI